MTVTVNGKPTDWSPGLTVADVVAALTEHVAGVAVAVNDTVVPRGAWSGTPVEPGDRVEVLTAVQGG
jgi:sulfur carrier protein